MPGSDKTANFDIKVNVTAAKAKEAALDLEKLKSKITQSKNKIDEYRIALRAVTGADDKAKAAKKEIVKNITLEQNAISKANIQMRAAKGILDKYSKATKDSSKETKGFSSALALIGGPAEDAKSKVSLFGEGLATAITPAGALGLALAATLAITVAFVAGIVAGTYALAKFTVEAANALRAMNLQREAATGSAQNARNFGHDVEFMAQRLATPKEKLNDLAVAMAKTLGQSRVSGQGIEDTFEAVSSASEAMGDDTGRALQGIIDRGKIFGRTGIGRFELQPHGLKFENVAGNLAKDMKISMQQAQLALLSGTAPVNAVAKALKESVNARFGEINAKKLLDLNVIEQKFHENLQNLTKNVNLEPFLKGLKGIADLFSDTTSTGHSLQVVITGFGNALGTLLGGEAKNLNTFFRQAIGLGLKMAITLVDIATSILTFAQSATGVFILKGALTGIAVTLGAIGVVVATVTAAMIASAVVVGTIWGSIVAVVRGVWNFIKNLTWTDITGAAIIDGFIAGISAGASKAKAAIITLGGEIKDAFKSALGIHSPSVVFHGYGQNIAKGTAQGIDRGSPAAQSAVSALVETPAPTATPSEGSQGPSGGSGSLGRPPISVSVTINGGGDAHAVASFVASDGVLEKITHAVEIALLGGGIPTQTPVPAQG